jgi:adenylate cyclase
MRNVLGRYELVGEIGRGDRSTTWLGFDRSLPRDVVVRLLHPGAVASAGLLEAFRRRAAATSEVVHAHAARLYDHGVDPVEGPVLVEERLAGEDLARRLARVGSLDLGAAVAWFGQAGRALTAAHERRVFHDAIHAGNLFLTRVDGDEVLKLVGFRVAGDGEGAAPSAARDVRMLAAVAQRALAGASLARSAAAVEAFFARALADDPGQGFQTAREFVDGLEALLAAGRRQPYKVLVVDDEPDAAVLIRARFRRAIRQGEYEFVFASDGDGALRALAEHGDFAAVLSDINMPRMDGLTFLRNARERRAHLKVIMVSAYGDLGNIRAAMNGGAFDFVTKPIDFGDLELTLQKAIREVAVLREALRRRAEAEQARSNLARYFPPSLVELLATGEVSFQRGVRSDATALFADIVGFTRMAEAMPPEDVLSLLRSFHGAMESEVFRHGGTLEKYIGDALLAVFGMPAAGPHDAANAVACARSMLAALDRWNLDRVARGEEHVCLGIGLHHGPVVVGDIGSERNMAVVAIGDTVNVASRVQALTRTFGACVVITQQVVDAVRAKPGIGSDADALLAGFVEVGAVEVHNRTAPVHVWKLGG